MANAESAMPNAASLYPIVRGTAAIAAVAATVVFLTPYLWLGALGLLVLMVSAPLFVFHGSTLVALKLRGRRRLLFQVLVVIVVSGVLAAYFVWRADAVPRETIKGWLNAWSLIPLGILGLIGYGLRDAVDRELPLRAFIVYAGILFIICFIGAAGLYYESDDDEHGAWYQDKQRKIEATEPVNRNETAGS